MEFVDFKEEVKKFLLNSSTSHLQQIDKWAEQAFPGVSLDVQSDTQSKMSQGDFLSAVRFLRSWIILDQSQLGTDFDILLRLRVNLQAWSQLFGIWMAQQSRGQAVRLNAKKASRARHAENDANADEIKRWYRENYVTYPNKDRAASEVVRLIPVKHKTAMKHISSVIREMRLESGSK